jgi:hypothetical protein
MQETALCARKHFRRVCEPIGLKECQHLRVQQRVASIKTVVTAVFTRELDTSQHDFGFFFHDCDGLSLRCSLEVQKSQISLRLDHNGIEHRPFMPVLASFSTIAIIPLAPNAQTVDNFRTIAKQEVVNKSSTRCAL